MSYLKISKTKDFFEYNNKAFFYLADTLWSAFTNISDDEWVEYLDFRRNQGFNVLQINILPQWDRSTPDLGYRPFRIDTEGKTDYYSFNPEYFERAQKMLELAVAKGFIPALVILWCDFVKDTWASKRMPDHIMPLEAVKPYVEYVVHSFSKFHPIYLVSGDTDFETGDTKKYFRIALETIKSMTPTAITTMHLAGGITDLPEEYLNSSQLDFYMYQSSHKLEEQHLPYTMAQNFYQKEVKRPVVNGEPCYEGHGHGDKYGRFIEFDIRKAAWQSLLSGAKAGITYGAHGIWSWHRTGMNFPSESFSKMPFDWRTALRFQGAWDVSFAKWIFETYNLFDIEPVEKVLNETEEIRMSVSEDTSKVVLYIPYNIDVKVRMDLQDYHWVMINLSDKYFAKPMITIEKNISVINMHDFNSDVLMIGTK